ncbi:hypothetical protein QUB25_01620 [Microcoleus sp. B3-D7]
MHITDIIRIVQIYTNFTNFAAIIKEVCDSGYADRIAIWAELTTDEQSQFSKLVAAESVSCKTGEF